VFGCEVEDEFDAREWRVFVVRREGVQLEFLDGVVLVVVLVVGDRLFFTFGYRALAEQPIGAVPEVMTGMRR
jgi:hypothetical protein